MKTTSDVQSAWKLWKRSVDQRQKCRLRQGVRITASISALKTCRNESAGSIALQSNLWVSYRISIACGCPLTPHLDVGVAQLSCNVGVIQKSLTCLDAQVLPQLTVWNSICVHASVRCHMEDAARGWWKRVDKWMLWVPGCGLWIMKHNVPIKTRRGQAKSSLWALGGPAAGKAGTSGSSYVNENTRRKFVVVWFGWNP